MSATDSEAEEIQHQWRIALRVWVFNPSPYSYAAMVAAREALRSLVYG